ncbi:MAG: glucose-1-phosphate thymidylyltransferase [Ignavibacteriae bacterium]|nr:glucose-1-phosphate thymidylyltransferase [Ignavibacteriota bacterium]
MKSICIFEDEEYKQLQPLTFFRPSYHLKCGILSLHRKIRRNYPNVRVELNTRGYLRNVIKQNHPSEIVNHVMSDMMLFLNGRILVDDTLVNQIPLDGKDEIFVSKNNFIGARVSEKNLESISNSLKDVLSINDFPELPRKEVDVTIINYPWDLITYNHQELIKDFKKLTSESENFIKDFPGVYFLNKENIFLGKDVKIKPGVILDAEEGPIFIGDNVQILHNASIQGPVFIGEETIVKMSATIYHNTSVGKVSKIGGEIENTIIHSYSNKQHNGFLGNSYLGSWVNLGAGTTNSDLKNNYGTIKVLINNQQIDSGKQFVGLTMGDHSKAAINTSFNTGAVVGVSSNIFGGTFPPRYIPSFSWGGSEALTTYDIDRSIEVAERVMQRRNVILTDIDKELFRTVFKLTEKERRDKGFPK